VTDDGWKPLPSGGAEAVRIELLHQRSVALWREAHDLWLWVSVGLGLGVWPDQDEADRVTHALEKAAQAQSEWWEASGRTE